MLVITDPIIENSKIEIIDRRKDYFVAQLNQTDEKVALSILDLEGEDPSKLLIRNISMFNHDLPNVSKLLAYYIPTNDNSEKDSEYFSFELKYKGSKVEINRSSIILITELPKYDNVNNLKKSRHLDQTDILTPTVTSKIIFGVAAIMKKLHQRKIFGIRLKNESVFLDKNHEPIIFDFGFYDIIKDIIQQHHAVIISDNFYDLPPEYAENEDDVDKIDSSYDVYSYGMFLYRLLSSEFYFNIKSHTYIHYMRKIVNCERPLIKDEIPQCYKDLIRRCWYQDPKERPTFTDIVDELKNDEFALFDTDIHQLHEYQERMDSEKVDSLPKHEINLKFFVENILEK